MINFFSETLFSLENPNEIAHWISKIINDEKREEGDISYIFCDDQYLHKLNLKFLNHDSYTDIISFDNSLGNQINGEIFISIERVKENANTYKTNFEDELHRVIIHGILHYCGFNDKTKAEVSLMRKKEDEALSKRVFV